MFCIVIILIVWSGIIIFAIAGSKKEIPGYKIINSVKIANNEITYNVLIDKVNLNNNKYESNIKAISKDILKKNDNDISVKFFDSVKALKLYNKYYNVSDYSDFKNPEDVSNNSKNILSRHYIASFVYNSNGSHISYFFYADAENNEKYKKYYKVESFIKQ